MNQPLIFQGCSFVAEHLPTWMVDSCGKLVSILYRTFVPWESVMRNLPEDSLDPDPTLGRVKNFQQKKSKPSTSRTPPKSGEKYSVRKTLTDWLVHPENSPLLRQKRETSTQTTLLFASKCEFLGGVYIKPVSNGGYESYFREAQWELLWPQKHIYHS